MSSKFNILFFAAALALLCLFLFILPPDPDASRYENRTMESLPDFNLEDVLSGKYSDGLESYLSDRIAFRTEFLAFSASMENRYGLQLGGATLVEIDYNDLGSGLIADREPAVTGDPENKPGKAGAEGLTPDEDEPFTLPPSDGRRIMPGDSFGVDIHSNPNVVFYVNFYVDGESVAQYVDTLNTYRQVLPESVRIFCLLVPSLVEFMDERYSGGDGVQGKAINSIYNRFDYGVTPVDAYKRIAERVDDEYLYFRTDHHWTTLGAYYAYLAFAEAAALDPITIDNYVEFAFPDFIGSLVTGTPDRIVLDNPDTLYYYQIDDGTTFSESFFLIPEEMDELGYIVFMGGDHAVLDYRSSNENGKMLIIIKDSIANAFIPWVSPHYERIVVLDPRLYEERVSMYLDDSMETDILFVNSSLTPSLSGFVESLAGIMSRGAGPGA